MAASAEHGMFVVLILVMNILRLHSKSPVTRHTSIYLSHQLQPINVFVKRDDQLQGFAGLSGNKGRKFIDLMKILAAHDGLQVVSHGGTQSNSMGAIARLVDTMNKLHQKNHIFTYYTKKLSEMAKKSINDESNLSTAINTCHMQHIEVDEGEYGNIAELVNRKGRLSNIEHGKVYIPIGGFGLISQNGCKQLAKELAEDMADISASYSIKKFAIVFACGTGTTAFYTANELYKFVNAQNNITEGINRIDVQVLAVPCVGNGNYVQRQMESLPLPDCERRQYPFIVENPGKNKPFGSVNKLHYDLWSSLQAQLQMQLDLLYFPKCMETFVNYLQSDAGQTLYNSILTNQAALLYYHCGGVEGNLSQLRRYKYAKIL